MSVQVQTTLHNAPRNINLRIDLNSTLTVEVHGENATWQEVLNKAAEELGRTIGGDSFIAVGSGGSRRVESLDDEIGDAETLVVDRQRSNG